MFSGRSVNAIAVTAALALSGCGRTEQPDGTSVSDSAMKQHSLPPNIVDEEVTLLKGELQNIYQIPGDQLIDWYRNFEKNHPGEYIVDIEVSGQARRLKGSTEHYSFTSYVAVTRKYNSPIEGR